MCPFHLVGVSVSRIPDTSSCCVVFGMHKLGFLAIFVVLMMKRVLLVLDMGRAILGLVLNCLLVWFQPIRGNNSRLSYLEHLKLSYYFEYKVLTQIED